MPFNKIFYRVAVIALSVLFCGHAAAQNRGKCDDGSLADSDGYKIRATKVGLRYSSVTLPPKGTPYTKAIESKLLEDVAGVMKADENRESTPGGTLSQISGKVTLPSARMITACVSVVAKDECEKAVGQEKCVDITVFARTLRFSLSSLADNVLSAIPRSNKPTILENVPKPLLALNPSFKANYDKEQGFMPGAEISANLLDLDEILHNDAVSVKSARLDLSIAGSKSLNKDFYDSSVKMAFTRILPSLHFEKIFAAVEFSASHLPGGKASILKNAVSLTGGVSLKSGLPVIQNIDLAASYSHSSNRFYSSDPALSVGAEENGLAFRVLTSGRIKRDFLRLGFWADGGKSAGGPGAYHRFSGLAGYAKDLGKGNQTFGLEVTLGAGKAIGTVPNYALYYGGSALKNFIYEARDADVMQKMPAGAMIRSFGEGRSANGDLGGRSYWHVNFNLSIPVKKWSAPLIPDEPVDIDEDAAGGGCPIATVKQLIKCQAASGATILAAIYKDQGVPDFAEKAQREFKGTNSAIGFLVDHANIYSIKPLFMFDAANFNAPGNVNKTRVGVGGGMQLNIVIAKFEAGYMRTVNRQPGDSRGNFIMRLYFQNLF
jgi:hypothetical protein